MNLSAPIYLLKKNAKSISREQGIPLHESLNRIATQEGFASWSQLARTYSEFTPAKRLLAKLHPGDLILIAARPGQGKSLLGLELSALSVKRFQRGYFFSLEFTRKEIAEHLSQIGFGDIFFDENFRPDVSDEICAHYIRRTVNSAPPGTVIVVDYLQLLDQNRQNPPLDVQIHDLQELAETRKLMIALIAQVDRSFDDSGRRLPELKDIRMPNKLDLRRFTKSCFLNNGKIQLQG